MLMLQMIAELLTVDNCCFSLRQRSSKTLKILEVLAFKKYYLLMFLAKFTITFSMTDLIDSLFLHC